MTAELATLAFCGIGMVFLAAEELWYSYKVRCEARERTVGLNAVQAAEREGRILRP